MKGRLAFMLVAAGSLAAASPAFAASNDGEGLVGETNDKIVTFVSLGVAIFFVLLVIFLTVAQSAAERRKEAQKAARMQQRTGW
jgi:preprotein translocase subunit SecG